MAIAMTTIMTFQICHDLSNCNDNYMTVQTVMTTAITIIVDIMKENVMKFVMTVLNKPCEQNIFFIRYIFELQ